MILTINTQENTVNHSIAKALANRRASAGRDVLLLCQKSNSSVCEQSCVAEPECGWQATEMKAGAKSRELDTEEVIQELAETNCPHRDVIIAMPQLQSDEALSVLTASGSAIFFVRPSTWEQERLQRLLQQIDAARHNKPNLTILLILDEQDSAAAINFMASVTSLAKDARFIQLSYWNEIPIAELYRTIYLRKSAT